MTLRLEIAPSILAADFTRLGEQVRDAEAGEADRIHIDVMDGRFVPNITMGPLVVTAVRRATGLPLDVHLMIVEPDHLLADFAQAGASRIFVHWETCPNLHRTLGAIQALGCEAGIALNPHTPALLISEVLHKISAVCVMTVNPGFGGQAFLPETLPKIAALRQMFEDRPSDIVVDGGINEETGKQVIAAGANVLVAGSIIFNEKHSVQDGLRNLRRALGK
ncbi:MAG: ribulose-phosphate 3-epimerase [Anaerolineae bacterium]|nr:ribulose-phosphate 3-epimerase [Anaerolineae bacterium]NUQ02727.1 ribulose-phosphate 3-epimerase [Anaerolineae bacterium]